jgi:electron transfer flavoprotein alpha/beta subunit
MQIYVCVKHVPDTAANIKIVGENGFDDGGCKFIANPYDEYAVEQAVQLVEKNGGEVIASPSERRRLLPPFVQPWPWVPTGAFW